MKRTKYKATIIGFALASGVCVNPLTSPTALASATTSKHAATTVHQTTSVTIGNHAGNAAICAAVKSYLEKTSSPSLFRLITIEKVVPVGEMWEVTLLVHHQPGKFSAYQEGTNIRFIELTVTGLASGR